MHQFSAQSLDRLNGVHPNLVRVVHKALELSPVDFTVLEGLRSLERQKQLLAKHATKTLDSKHRKQSDGYGHAVDLAPLENGQVSWQWPLYFKLQHAVRQAAVELGIRIVWGGCWDRCMNDLSDNLEAEVRAYCARHAGGDFLDGPHIQLK